MGYIDKINSAEKMGKIIGAEVPPELKPEDNFSHIANFDFHIDPECLYFPYYLDDAKKHLPTKPKAIVAEEKIEGIPTFVTKDITKAIYELDKAIYSDMKKLPSILVAGSEGKTSTLGFTKRVLEMKYNLFCEEYNYNTLHGLCRSLKSIKKEHNYILFETDEARKDNAKLISELLSPHIVCITNMLDSHMGVLGTQENINDSIAGVEAHLKDDGYIIINADDPESSKYNFKHNVISVGIKNKNADYVAIDIEESYKGISFNFIYGVKIKKIKISFPGKHNVYNAMMAFIVGKLEGIPERQIISAIKSYRTTGIRQNIWEDKGRFLFIDCYNSNATSLAEALKTFDEIPAKKGKRVAVVGDVGKDSSHSVDVYKRIAKSVDDSKVDILITYGESSKLIWDYLKKKIDKHHATTEEELISLIRGLESENKNNYLFKASGFMNLKHTVEKLFPELWQRKMKEEYKRLFYYNVKKKIRKTLRKY